MLPDHTTRYELLKKRHEELLRQQAAAIARKEEREKQRKMLIDSLKKSGVDMDHLVAEKERLEKEITAGLDQLDREITDAELQFTVIQSGGGNGSKVSL